ncbi:DUF305 domain-containing protein [Actinokineospora sp. HUAS TT18]|uniref:DUF305 domain-containing protein n=1 Tax=Actinokineospora sp. HUAS TT18 TaxID=3447451 RepID=UPI003F5209C2
MTVDLETSLEVAGDQSANATRSTTPRGRALVLSAAAVAVLLVGAAIGMLITLARVGSAAPPEAGSVDVGFAQDMSVHHMQAVSLAGWARDHSVDPAIRQLAFDMELTQQGQVGAMSGWLDQWGQPQLPEGGRYMAWMAADAGHGHAGAASATVPAGGVALMPGMATRDEITRMWTMSGRELDVYFLQLILRHHGGGSAMSRYAATNAAQDVVRTFADKIVISQTAEMTTIESMLADRGARPLP